jgi:ketosteroid isomerase-like protein
MERYWTKCFRVIPRDDVDARSPTTYKRLERTRHERASLLGCVGDPLKRSLGAKETITYKDIMRKTLVISVLIFTIVSIALAEKQSARRNQNRSVEQVIRQLDYERIQAQVSANAVALNRIYADDFIGIGPSGTVRTKPQVISDFTSGDLKFQSITTHDVRVRVYGNTAVETGRSTMIGQDKGKAVPRDNRFTRVWIKQFGRWRLVANHYSPLITQ